MVQSLSLSLVFGSLSRNTAKETLHVIGSNNNLGRTPEMDAEYSERNAANMAWMRQAFDLAMRSGSKAIMIIAQANPRLENSWPPYVQQRYMLAGLGFKSPETRRATGFDEFLAALEKETVAIGKPVVYVHGDSHIFRVDKPLFGSTSRRFSCKHTTTIATKSRTMAIEVPNTDPILDPAWAGAAVTGTFGAALSAFRELLRYAVQLLKRTLTTGPDDVPHHLILSVLFRQAIATSDSACELIGVGACDAAHVQLRALMEARWGLMLAITDPKKWGTHLYVASRRERLVRSVRQFLERQSTSPIRKLGI
jgi:hypothetical protein